jgi:hypothetical protein
MRANAHRSARVGASNVARTPSPVVLTRRPWNRPTSRTDEPEVRGVALIAEQALPAAEHDREDHEAQLIHQVELHQRIDQIGAPEDEDVPAGPLLSRETSVAMSPRMIVVLFHVASRRVVDATYFSRPFILSANPSSLGAAGQNAAKI